MKNVLTFTLSLFMCLSIWQTALAQPVNFTKQTLGTSFIPREVDHADLNNDGHIDIISAEATTGKMHWWKNNGASNPSFTKIQFDNNFEQAQNFITVDLNGDGRIDIINGSYTLDQVAVWLNNGEPGTPTFTKQIIKNFNGPLDLAAGDMDNDGDIDVAVLGQAATANKLIVLWNDGNLMPSFTTTELGSSPVRANKRGLVVADYNKDGKKDVIVNHDVFVQVKFFRNLGGQQFQDRTISTGFFTENYAVADMNGDSHMDVLMTIRENGSSSPDIGYLENSGIYNPNNTNPTFSKAKKGSVPIGTYVYPADLDNDGNMDILYSYAFGDAFEWAHNSGGANPTFTKYVIDANPGEAYVFKAADLDGDGDLDPYGSEFQKIVWFENDLMSPLELSCPNDITVDTDQGVCNAYVSIPAATATGGCGNNTIIDSENGTGDASGTFDRGNTTVIYTVVDVCGNTDNCTTTITVNDNQGPQLVCRSGNINLSYDGTFTFGASDVTSVSVDNCNENIFVSASPASVDCDDIGSTIAVEVTWRDNSWNTSTCIANITVQDIGNYCCASPSAVCNDFTVILDGNGEGSITFEDVAGESEAPCGLAFENLSETDFDCYDIGGPNVVTYTITDGYADNDNCTSNITVVDNTPPTPLCKTGTVYLNENGDYTLTETDVFDGGTDNCGSVTYVSSNPAVLTCIDAGNTVSITVTAEDGSGNTATCIANITVEDDTPPVPTCKTATVYLNGDGNYTLTEADVFNGGTDNCGTVSYVSSSPASFTCADDGNTISVTVIAEDSNDNTATCTATITVEESGDMPSGWAAYDIGQISMGNDYYYAACDALPTYTVTGSGNNSISFTTDNVAFAGYQLCGDGSITVKVESITPNGYGGVMIREDDAPGAKQVSLFSNLSNTLRHEYRSSTNGMKIVGSFFKPNPIWLKLDRQGAWIFAYSSYDGYNFQYVHGAYVPMQSCVEFGMASFTWLPWAQTEAVFSNVTISGGNGGMAVDDDTVTTPAPQYSTTIVQNKLHLYPNPNNGNFTLQLDQDFEEEVQLVLYNQYGQIIEKKILAPQSKTIEWNISAVNAGTYFMHLTAEGIAPRVKAFVVQP
ncbi:MAG: FG-GAP-like repeat-containing protein [Chitinophagales bacterium]|nr:FG-GAP-like repeat-containing protein [Chitinophagales bacterium]